MSMMSEILTTFWLHSRSWDFDEFDDSDDFDDFDDFDDSDDSWAVI